MNRFKNSKKFIYIISPNTIKNDSFYKDLEFIFKTRKVAYFQLRLKKDKQSNIIYIGKKIKKLCNKFNVKLLINDSPILAKKIGAVNTIVNDNGKLIGYNTDVIAVEKSLKPLQIKNDNDIIIFGAGGVSRAILVALKNLKLKKFLKKKLRYSHIEKIYSFTVAEWKKSESDILNLITKNFNSAPVIVRSSAIGEDSIFESQAGNYDSIQNIDSLSISKLEYAINTVILSYEKKGNKNPQNIILIQTQTSDIVVSGVTFTREPSIGAPYFVINFEEGNYLTIEFAGILKSSKNKEQAKEFMEFILSPEFQSVIPSTNIMYPVINIKNMPIAYEVLKIPNKALQINPKILNSEKQKWIEEWLNAT